MKIFNFLSMFFLCAMLTIACNTTSGTNEDSPSNFSKKEQSEVQNSIDGESFPETGGLKARYNNRVFYIDVKDSGVKGFVRYKDSGKAFELEGKKTSPFDFECSEYNDDGEEIAKLRGKLSSNELKAEIEYSETSNANSLRFQAER